MFLSSWEVYGLGICVESDGTHGIWSMFSQASTNWPRTMCNTDLVSMHPDTQVQVINLCPQVGNIGSGP